jgi:hypothetical protein
VPLISSERIAGSWPDARDSERQRVVWLGQERVGSGSEGGVAAVEAGDREDHRVGRGLQSGAQLRTGAARDQQLHHGELRFEVGRHALRLLAATATSTS